MEFEESMMEQDSQDRQSHTADDLYDLFSIRQSDAIYQPQPFNQVSEVDFDQISDAPPLTNAYSHLSDNENYQRWKNDKVRMMRERVEDMEYRQSVDANQDNGSFESFTFEQSE